MRYLLIIPILFLFACKGDKINSASQLDVQKFVIETGRDTLIQTKKGALLDIPRGTIVVEKGSTVTIEIREAYSIEDMIRARLVTQADGEPLSSGGMIYVNVVSGQQVRFNGRIRVATPTEFFQEGMQLYKGSATSDGTVNWVDPDSIVLSAKQRTIISGRQLFESDCKKCHELDTQLTAPALAHFTKVFPMSEENKPYYTHNIQDYYQINNIPRLERPRPDTSITVVDSTTFRPDTLPGSDEQRSEKYHKHFDYKCNLINRFNGTTGPAYEDHLTAAQINSIFEYIENASERLNIPLVPNELKDCIDSCFIYDKLVRDLEKKKQQLKDKRTDAIRDNGGMIKQNPPTNIPVTSNTSTNNRRGTYDDLVTRTNYQSEYYQFSIESFGWFNIDIPLKNIPGFQDSKLIVQVQGEYRSKTEVFMIIPSKKVYLEGGRTGNVDEYAFVGRNGQIFLPHGQKAYILALSEMEGELAFALTEFVITKDQQFTIDPKASTKQQFDEAIKQLAIMDMKISVIESKNADSVRYLDATLKNIDEKINEAQLWKPESCDCACGEEGMSPKTYR